MSKPPVRPIRRVVSPPILRPAVKPASPPVKGVEKEKCTDEVSEEKRSVASVRPVMRPLSRPAVRPVTQPPRPVVVAKKAEEKNNEVAEGSNKVPDAKPEPHAKTQAPQTNPTVRRVGMPPRVASPPRTVSPAPAVSPRPAASSSAPASNPIKGRRSSSLVPGNGSVSEPKKPQGRRRSGLAAAAGEIRTAEEQQQYRDDGLSEMDRRGYALADQGWPNSLLRIVLLRQTRMDMLRLWIGARLVAPRQALLLEISVMMSLTTLWRACRKSKEITPSRHFPKRRPLRRAVNMMHFSSGSFLLCPLRTKRSLFMQTQRKKGSR